MLLDSLFPLSTQTSTTEEITSTETIQKSIYCTLSHRISVSSIPANALASKKLFSMHSSMVDRKLSQTPYVSEFPSDTPFYVLLSEPSCALKSPSWTIYANVSFCKATPTLLKKGWYYASLFGAYACKTQNDRSGSLIFRRQTLLPHGIQSVSPTRSYKNAYLCSSRHGYIYT